MKALLSDLQLKLFESDPTPDLDTIRALWALPCRGGELTTFATLPAYALPHNNPCFPEQASLHSDYHDYSEEIQALTAKVDGLIEGQASLVAALATSSPSFSKPAAMDRIVCCNCQQLGHIARNCPHRHGTMGTQHSRRRGQNRPNNIISCSLCGGQGHLSRECANNRTPNLFHSVNNVVPQ